MTLHAPVLLKEAHLLGHFDCGVTSLDDWLKRRAFKNQISGASRTYVVSTSQEEVIGYYCLSSGCIDLKDALSGVRRNMPDPIPVAILGRLAVDRAWHHRGVGSFLLHDAVSRTAQACAILGIRGLLVHALSEEAKTFYEHFGCVSSSTQPMTLVLSLKKF